MWPTPTVKTSENPRRSMSASGRIPFVQQQTVSPSHYTLQYRKTRLAFTMMANDRYYQEKLSPDLGPGTYNVRRPTSSHKADYWLNTSDRTSFFASLRAEHELPDVDLNYLLKSNYHSKIVSRLYRYDRFK